jgi:hypothetical protein
MKPTNELTPKASAALDNFIHINFEQVNGLTDEEHIAQELQNAGLSSESQLEDMNESHWKEVTDKYEEYEAYDGWMGE